MPNLVKSAALWLHQMHSDIYSSYKIKQYGLKPSLPLTAKERDFYLKFRPALQGKNLVVYDIGAAKGYVSQCLAKLNNVLKVYAFEPIPDVFDHLKAQVKDIPKIYCYNVALGDFSGPSVINISKKSDSSSLLSMANLHTDQFSDTEITHQQEINVVRLDDFIYQHQLPQPDLIKIDVQGFEKNVIEGGYETLKKAKYCVLEMSFKPLYEGSPLFDDIYRLMTDLGFSLIGFSSPLIGKSGDYLQVDGIFENTR
jgi:FkbM family methyltransferase